MPGTFTHDGVIYRELGNGQVEVVGYANAPAPMTLGTPDPAAAYEAPKAAADLQRTRAQIAADAADAARKAQTAPYDARKAAADAALAEAQLAKASTEVRKSAVGKAVDPAAGLQRAINDMRAAYAAGPGATSGIAGLQDFLPTEANANFDKAASAARGYVGPALGLTASQLNSPAEIEAAIGPYIPTSKNYDSSIESTFERLQGLANDQRKRAGYQGPVDLPARAPYTPSERREIATGSTRNERDPRIEAIVNSMIRGGATADDINAAVGPMGGYSVTPEAVTKAQAYLRANPTYKGGFSETMKPVNQSLRERVSGSATGAFLANGFNDAAAGIPGAVLGTDSLQAQQAAFPNASAAGGLVGGVAGASALELGLARGAARLGGGALARFVGSPHTADAVYGGVQGATSTSSPTGAATGVVAGLGGGMLGRGLTRASGRALRGVTGAEVQRLNQAGIPLTAGQALGGVAKGVEDRLAGVPVIGDVVRNRRLEGLREFNRTAFDQGLSTINATTAGTIGEEGIDLARGARSQAYRRALDPVILTPDAQFGAEIASARGQAARLPADMAERGRYALDRAIENGPTTLSGNGFQQGVRRFRRTTSQNAPLPNGDDLGDVMRSAEGAFTGLLQRQAPGALPAFNAANTANRNVEVLRDAVNKARNGTRTGETGVFAPSQLADAAASNARRFGNTAGTTQQPFFELSRAGQAVLPSQVPDSGTAGRLALLALPAAFGGAGAGAGYAGGDTSGGTAAGLGLGAALTIGGTRGAQRVLTRALLDRPDALIRIGDRVYNRAQLGGMFGAGAGASLLAQ